MSASQSPHPYRFQDINLSLLRRLSAAMCEGNEKYEQGLAGHEKNYLQADTKFALSRISNAIHHLFQLNDIYLSKLRGVTPIAEEEDHLGHCAANLNMLAEWERLGILPSSLPSQPSQPQIAVQNSPWEGPPVTDQEESIWRGLGHGEAVIAARIKIRGKA